MRSHNFSLNGIRIRVAIEGTIAARRVFPSLHALPRSTAEMGGWRVTVGVSKKRPFPSDAIPAQAVRLRVWPDVDAALWETPDGCQFAAEGAVAQLWPAQRRAKLTFTRRALRTTERLGRVLVMEIMRCEGLFTFHAGAVETGGGVVLICGPSGSGKSTLATAWACMGNARFVAEDRCLVCARLGRFWAEGVHDEIGLRQVTVDLLGELGVRVPEPSAVQDGKCYYNPHDVFLSLCQESHPLRAIIFLVAVPGGGPPVRVASAEAFRRMQDGNFFKGPSRTMREQFDIIADLSARVPAFLAPAREDCRATIAALDSMLAAQPAEPFPLQAPAVRHSRRMPRLRGFDALRCLRRILGGRPAACRTAAFDEPRWVEIVRAADAAGLLTPLAAALEANASLNACRSPIPNVLRVARTRAAATRARQHSLLARLAPPLDAARVRWLVVGGPGLAERFYSPQWSRGDPRLAIAVEAGDGDRARQVMASLSFTPTTAQGAPVRARALLLRDAKGIEEVTLLDPACTSPAWFHRPAFVHILDRMIPVLSPHRELLWSCTGTWPEDTCRTAQRSLDAVRIWMHLSARERTAFYAAARRDGRARAVLERALRLWGYSGSHACHRGTASAQSGARRSNRTRRASGKAERTSSSRLG